MNTFDFDPHNVGAMFADNDDRRAPIEPPPRPNDMSFRLASAFLKMMDRERERWEFRTFDDVVLPDGSKRKDPRPDEHDQRVI